ncbi:MAG TPA: hypothetical protein VFM18_14910 [Methanosarcina sp.]|nr:hypothetical protein [Methanosarcina sp.]
MEANTTMKVDAKAFLLQIAKNGMKAIDYAYPNGYLDRDKTHSALLKAKEDFKAIEAFLNSLS